MERLFLIQSLEISIAKYVEYLKYETQTCENTIIGAPIGCKSIRSSAMDMERVGIRDFLLYTA